MSIDVITEWNTCCSKCTSAFQIYLFVLLQYFVMHKSGCSAQCAMLWQPFKTCPARHLVKMVNYMVSHCFHVVICDGGETNKGGVNEFAGRYFFGCTQILRCGNHIRWNTYSLSSIVEKSSKFPVHS